jgi:hypothetical protein
MRSWFVTTWFLVAALAVSACKQNEDKPATPAAGSAAPTAVPSAPVPAAGSAVADAAITDERCADPCRLLATVKLADLATELNKTCRVEWKPAAGDCDQPDYLRNCIYATAGYTFKKQQWRDAFGAKPWYKERADFKDTDLSPVAMANVAELKAQAKTCRGGNVTPEDQQLVEAWVDKLRTGKPQLPAVTFTHERVEPQTLKEQLLGTKADFGKGRKTEYRYTKFDWDGVFAGMAIRTVEFSPGNAEARGPNCDDEECESGNAVMIAIDNRNRIVGVSQMLSACPLVYIVSVHGKQYVGEILRNLARPELEHSQALGIQLPCAARVELEIAEQKRETTHLDAIALVAGDLVLAPDACSGALCSNDGVALTLDQGESIRISFTLPAAARCASAKLIANGHYVPR